MLSPSLQYHYITHNAMADSAVPLAALTSTLQVNVGYAAIW